MTTASRGSRAFTLVELMIVVSLVSVIAALGLPAYQKMICKTRQTEVKSILRNTGEAIKVYRHEHDTDVDTTGSFFIERDACHVHPDLTIGAPGNAIGFDPVGKSKYWYRICVGQSLCGLDYWADARDCEEFPAPGAGEYWTMDSTVDGVTQLRINRCAIDG